MAQHSQSDVINYHTQPDTLHADYVTTNTYAPTYIKPNFQPDARNGKDLC